MSQEIEKKYLVDKSKIKIDKEKYTEIKQGYISNSEMGVVRVRTSKIIVNDSSQTIAYLTIKGKNSGMTRSEFEYEIPFEDAIEMLEEFCDKLIEKTRFYIVENGKTWEVDFFEGENQGLIIAELELSDELESFIVPEWVTKDVTEDNRYYNNNLLNNPISNW